MPLQPPRPITPDDSIIGFTSGEASLDAYLAKRALANHLADLARCYVSVNDNNEVVGYYTLSAVAIQHSELHGRIRRNAPNPIPEVLLGRLAVRQDYQGIGLVRACYKLLSPQPRWLPR